MSDWTMFHQVRGVATARLRASYSKWLFSAHDFRILTA
jgi:hypothetical protein